MPATFSPREKATIAQFVAFTQVKDSIAAKALKAANWDITSALNSHYSKPNKHNAASLGPVISKIFDEYRDDSKNPDSMGVDGTMQYLNALGVSLEEPASVAVLNVIGAEAVGEIERAKFVSGWEERNVSSIAHMKAQADQMRHALAMDPAFYKTVYKHAFLLARQPGQKSVQLDMAVEFWRLMFSQQGLDWKTASTDWLGLWLEFLQSKWTRSVSRDMWNQTEVFARKTLKDETLSFWNEDASWPTVIDDFVAYVKEKRNMMET